MQTSPFKTRRDLSDSLIALEIFDLGHIVVTPNELIERLERYSGIALKEAFAIPDFDREIKWHRKYARQNGIHVSRSS